MSVSYASVISEMSDNFFEELGSIFKEHYIDTPEPDILWSLAEKLDEAEAKMDDLFFKPSLDLDRHQYSIFLTYASVKELEEDLLFKNTYWEIAKHFDDCQKEFDVWFIKDVGITRPPPGSASAAPPKPAVGDYDYEYDEFSTTYLGVSSY